MSVRSIRFRLASMNLVRWTAFTAWVTVMLSTTDSTASGEAIGGAHVGYAIGGSFGQQNSGLRHGLDLALLPQLLLVHHDGGGQGVESSSGLAWDPRPLSVLEERRTTWRSTSATGFRQLSVAS